MNDKIKVVIDAGHGGTDPGAVGNDLKEKDITLMISKYMLERFKELGIPATLIRSSDETISPTERVKRVLDAYGNDPNVIVISNHINSAATQGAQGAEVIYALRNDSTLARNILKNLGNAGQITRSYYQKRLPSDQTKDYYFIMRNTGNTQPVLIEYGFINNKTDIQRVVNNYKKYVNAVVDAVVETFNINTNTYTVKAGDSLWSIAQKFNTTVNDLKRLNNLNSNIITIGQVLKIPNSNDNTGNYVVKSGDTLWSIANKYNTTVNDLKRLNNLTSDQLSIGQTLKIPTSGDISESNIYTVKAGDSLWSIAQQFNVSVDDIKQLNNLKNNIITIGQMLKIPNSSNSGVGRVYIVQKGDSLWSIAQKYNTTVDNLRRINNLTSDVLTIGQKLFV